MMARKSKIDEDCEGLSIVADPWNLKLKPAKLTGDPLDVFGFQLCLFGSSYPDLPDSLS